MPVPTYVNVGVQRSPYVVSVGIPGIDDLHDFQRSEIGIAIPDEIHPGKIQHAGTFYDSRANPAGNVDEWQKRNASRQIEPRVSHTDTDPENEPIGDLTKVRDPRTVSIIPTRPTQTHGPRFYSYTRIKSPYGARMESNSGNHASYAVPSKEVYGAHSAQRARIWARQTRRNIPTPLEHQIVTTQDTVAFENEPLLAQGSSLARWY